MLIIEIEPGAFLAEKDGVRGWTTEESGALAFETTALAEVALAEAREFNPFVNASIVPQPAPVDYEGIAAQIEEMREAAVGLGLCSDERLPFFKPEEWHGFKPED